MEPADENPTGTESLANFEQAVRDAGMTMPSDHQLERWRAEGLLPRVRQVQIPYHGSTVEFPSGTGKQILEIQRLLKINKRFDYVGWELWWAGFPVDEKYWKPRLENSSKIGDRALRILKILMWKEYKRSDDLATHSDTIFDQKSELPVTNNIFSRINRRIKENQIGQLLRVFVEIDTGRFEKFDDPNDLSDSSDQAVVTRALDIHDANSFISEFDEEDPNRGKHIVLGKRLNLSKEMPSTFAGLSRVLRAHKLTDVLHFPQNEIESARDDVRGALSMADDLYHATNWIFGERALGLRLLAWIAERSTPSQKSIFILALVLMRRDGDILLPSEEIAANALAAEKMRADAIKLKAIAATDLNLKKLLNPKALRLAFSDKGQFELFLNKLEKTQQRSLQQKC